MLHSLILAPGGKVIPLYQTSHGNRTEFDLSVFTVFYSLYWSASGGQLRFGFSGGKKSVIKFTSETIIIFVANLTNFIVRSWQ